MPPTKLQQIAADTALLFVAFLWGITFGSVSIPLESCQNLAPPHK